MSSPRLGLSASGLRSLAASPAGRFWLILAAIALFGAALRAHFLVGFGLGDDVTYIDYAHMILDGHYPPLDPHNQYAYRPLLLLSLAGGIGLFGTNDIGVAAPFFAASLASLFLVALIVRRFGTPRDALVAAFLFAIYPFNVVGCTTIHNDILLDCFVHAGLLALLVADDSGRPRSAAFFAALGGLAFILAFLVKVTVVSGLLIAGFWTLLAWRRRRAFPRHHLAFYATLGLGLILISIAYYRATGDPFYQYKCEIFFYRNEFALAPDEMIRAQRGSWLYYFDDTFRATTDSLVAFNEHGWFYPLFVLAVIVLAARRLWRPLAWLGGAILVHLLFLHFFPQQLAPVYLPIPRQTRYLESIAVSLVAVCGLGLSRLFPRRSGLLAAGAILAVASFISADQLWQLERGSGDDVRALATFLHDARLDPSKPLLADAALYDELWFFNFEQPHGLETVRLESALPAPDRPCYFVTGGARLFWWDPDTAAQIPDDQVPPNWHELFRLDRPWRPWRLSSLRLYEILPRRWGDPEDFDRD